MKTPGEPMDDKQRYMRQLEGTWDVRKLDFYYRRLRKEQGAEEAPEREAREVGASVRARKTKRGQRSVEESRLRNVLVWVLSAAGGGAWRVRNWLLLVAILGFGTVTVVSALAGSNLQTIVCGGLVALLGIVLFIFA